jgi:tetratricopeptide (TPR) repeat protein
MSEKIFFWFDLENLTDLDIIKLFKEQQVENTITLWQQAIDTADNKDKRFRNQKNLSISYSILLASGRFKPYLSLSLKMWEDLITSEEFWAWFFERYRQKTEFDLNAETMNEFKTSLPELLSNLYAEIGQITQDPDYFKGFQRKFSVKGEKIDKEVLSPLLNRIFLNIEKMNAIAITKGDYLRKTKFDKIIQIINRIQEDISNLAILGLDTDSQVMVARDKAADTISSRGALILNNWGDPEKASVMLQRARSICGTQVTTAQIDENIATVNGIMEQKKKFGKPIKSAPTLYTLNGCGTVLYGDTQYFALIFIPILPLARFSVEQVGKKQYKFFGKLKLHHWQQIWIYLFVAAIGFLIINYWIFMLLLIWFIYLKISDKPFIQPWQPSGCIPSTVNYTQSEYYYNLGIKFMDANEYEKALAAYDKALTFNDKNADIWNNKSCVLIELGRYNEAIEAAKTAVQLAPNDTEIRDTLQEALTAKGKVE